MNLPAIATTSIGSFPRLTWLAATERNKPGSKVSGDDLSRAMDDAIVVALSDQENIGLDIATDGEIVARTSSFTSPALGTASTQRNSVIRAHSASSAACWNFAQRTHIAPAAHCRRFQ